MLSFNQFNCLPKRTKVSMMASRHLDLPLEYKNQTMQYFEITEKQIQSIKLDVVHEKKWTKAITEEMSDMTEVEAIQMLRNFEEMDETPNILFCINKLKAALRPKQDK